MTLRTGSVNLSWFIFGACKLIHPNFISARWVKMHYIMLMVIYIVGFLTVDAQFFLQKTTKTPTKTAIMTPLSTFFPRKKMFFLKCFTLRIKREKTRCCATELSMTRFIFCKSASINTATVSRIEIHVFFLPSAALEIKVLLPSLLKAE